MSDLEKGLMAALGDSFEFVGGELGYVESGFRIQGQLWFARVRPKKSGNYAIMYSVRFDYPEELQNIMKGPLRVKEGEYILPFRIGERGTPRIVGGEGVPAPIANVGDTLIIPIHVDHFRTGHVFSAPGNEKSEVRASFSISDENRHEQILKRVTDKPVVRNDANEQVKLLASWGQSSINRPLTELHHSLTAYLEFRKPGDFNLTGRLVEADVKHEDDGIPFRVLPRDQPVTVRLGWMWRREGSHTIDHFPSGTLEARVGDRVLIYCGGYVTPAKRNAMPEPYRPAVVMKPFKVSETYVSLPKN